MYGRPRVEAAPLVRPRLEDLRLGEAAIALAVQVMGEPGTLDAGTEVVRRLGFKPDGTERIAAWA
jgi:hypothetical protein